MQKSKQFPSELRYDPVSKDWVVIATGRARRPNSFKKNHRASLPSSKKDCPFERLDLQEHPTLMMYKGRELPVLSGRELPGEWTTVSLPNKFPAFSPQGRLITRIQGPYEATDGAGFHEVIVTEDHAKDIPQFSQLQAEELVEAYRRRYLALKEYPFVNYISIFKNKGPAAGASVAHPHSQLMAIPVLDPDIQRSLSGSKEYAEAHDGECIHCRMLEWDAKEKSRVVFENDCIIALCPFASKVAFELRIYPKKHSGYFEWITQHEIPCFAEALRKVLRKLSRALNDPDYNYFIHTAPADKGSYDYYHWHLEILPKTSTWAGFELGTGIPISTIEPENAAAFLRKH
ncbi:MAG: DUF4921 family protein [bacterium]|nr:DUF4921 family protein [bacterium]